MLPSLWPKILLDLLGYYCICWAYNFAKWAPPVDGSGFQGVLVLDR